VGEPDEIFRKNLNGTFGHKKSKKINETIGGIIIDKSLYTQDNTRRTIQTLSSERRHREVKEMQREQDLPRESMPPPEQPELLSI
jgi:hypothetical protein